MDMPPALNKPVAAPGEEPLLQGVEDGRVTGRVESKRCQPGRCDTLSIVIYFVLNYMLVFI